MGISKCKRIFYIIAIEQFRSVQLQGVDMKQFTYEVTHRASGRVERIRATAKTAPIARAHIVDYYGAQFDVADLFCDIDPPHRVLGEIDCTAPGAEAFALDLIAKGRA